MDVSSFLDALILSQNRIISFLYERLILAFTFLVFPVLIANTGFHISIIEFRQFYLESGLPFYLIKESFGSNYVTIKGHEIPLVKQSKNELIESLKTYSHHKNP